MKPLVAKSLFVSILCALSIGCEKKDDKLAQVSEEKLEQYALLGAWEIQTRIVNNISDMSVLCCEFVDFKTDQNNQDKLGEFTYTRNGEAAEGIFEVIDNETLEFNLKEVIWSIQFIVEGDRLSLSYDQAGDSISETWLKDK